MAYRLICKFAKEAGLNLYYTGNSAAQLTSDASRAKVYKTLAGASKALERTYRRAGLVLESFDQVKEQTRPEAIAVIAKDVGPFGAIEIYESLIRAGFQIIKTEQKTPVSK